MTNTPIDADGIYLSQYPIPLTPNEVEALLDKLDGGDDHAARKIIICLIEHRINHRYVRPLLHIPREYKSGFLMMATACLLIETLQTFYDGKNESTDADPTKPNEQIGSEEAFVRFFENNPEHFPDLRSYFKLTTGVDGRGRPKRKCTFYKNIRCGILHQAETTSGCRILRKGPLFSANENTTSINANLFVKGVNDSLVKYIRLLTEQNCTSNIWKMAKKKLRYICRNCRK